MKERPVLVQKIINLFKHLPSSIIACVFYGFPANKLKVIGVTGTDGKTTTVSLIYHILKKMGYSAGMISTVSAKFFDQEIDTGLHVTSPDSWFLQKLLKQMVLKKIEYVVLETTSHGLDQYRFFGINFKVGVITNITHEHLDYHKTLDRYTTAKLKLLKSSDNVVLNKDDALFESLYNRLKDIGKNIITYGITNKSNFLAQEIQHDFNGSNYILETEGKRHKVNLPIFGGHNIYNSLSALAAGKLLGLDLNKAIDTLKTFNGVEGRLQRIKNGLGIEIFIDFAHTPNALKKTLETLKGLTKKGGRLIAVFGSAGRRDIEKRPLMGEEAANFADLVILTTDDPRDEKVESISKQIASGCEKNGLHEISLESYLSGEKKKGYLLISDREEAIRTAIIKLAKKGDTIALCGKGHEKSLAVGDKELPWSEKNIVNKILIGGK